MRLRAGVVPQTDRVSADEPLREVGREVWGSRERPRYVMLLLANARGQWAGRFSAEDVGE